MRHKMTALFTAQDDFGKKDDDRKPAAGMSTQIIWSPVNRIAPRKMIKRIILLLGTGLLIYLFIHNIPTDISPRDRRHPVFLPPEKSRHRNPPRPGPMPQFKPGGQPLKPNTPPLDPKVLEDQQNVPRSYDGPIVFPKLSSSLNAIYDTDGTSMINKNVLFAAASLQSASLLLPLACKMGSERRNYVHFALMGGSYITLEDLRAVNGIGDGCHIIFHDARPDFPATSTIERLKKSVGSALYHIINYMHPQSIFIDSSGAENDYLLAEIRREASISGTSVIELPADSLSKLSWIANLDSSSLAAWNKVNIDILIHVSPGTTGSLVHLLKSLSKADYSVGPVPRLTIDLPANIDPVTTNFLTTFQWPPRSANGVSQPQQLIIRRRISRGRQTEEESTVRFLESFWPINPKYSHVLVLSPQVEVSPLFFHYLKYVTLHYLYSRPATIQQWDNRLLGFSLDIPATLLSSSGLFKPPTRRKTSDPSHSADDNTPFLWQAPNSHAALFTGQKWMELHILVSRILNLQRSRQQLPAFFTQKMVSKNFPAWMEHALTLSRVRGYWMLYPGAKTATKIATFHQEFYRAPEEFEKELAKTTPQYSEPRLDQGALFETLPGRGNLLPFSDMPLLFWDGTPTQLKVLDTAAADYANEFRRAVGGCEGLDPEELVPSSSLQDLFCVEDE